MYANLKNVSGFATTLRKISGANEVQQKGHLYEIMTANEFRKKGYSVLEIGKKFNDPAKKGLTDIDLVVKKGNTTYGLELKSYSQATFSDPKYRSDFLSGTLPADMQTLRAFQQQNPGSKIAFVIENKPNDIQALSSIERISKAQKVDVIYANAEELPILLAKL